MPNKLQSPGAFLTIMLEKYKLNPFKLSKDIQLSQSAVRLITIGKNKITTPVAMRLAKYFNTNPEFWLAMQMKWDIAEASKDKKLGKIIKGISRVKKAAAGEKKAPAKKKPRVLKKKAAKKKTAVKKPRIQRKTAAQKKAVTRKKSIAGKKPVVRKTVRTRKKVSGKRGRPAKK